MATYKDRLKNSLTEEPVPSGLRRWSGFNGMTGGGATATLAGASCLACLWHRQRQARQTNWKMLPFRYVYAVCFGMWSNERRDSLKLASGNIIVGFKLDVGVSVVTSQLQCKLRVQDKGAAK